MTLREAILLDTLACAWFFRARAFHQARQTARMFGADKIILSSFTSSLRYSVRESVRLAREFKRQRGLA